MLEKTLKVLLHAFNQQNSLHYMIKLLKPAN